MLLPSVKSVILKKAYGKNYLLIFQRANKLEIVLTLLTEVIIFHLQVALIEIEILEPKKSIKIISGACLMILGLLTASLNKIDVLIAY